MSRLVCLQCQRPVKSCICQFISLVENKVSVIILQHPLEVKQSKGTVSLLQRSLSNCHVIVGENFSENAELNALLQHYQHHCYLLYPEEATLVANVSPIPMANSCLILLDGTWKKSYRMYQLSKNLHGLTKLTLPSTLTCLYQIRKTRKTAALSTLEATVHALSSLEHRPEAYQPLLNNFIKFNQFQLSFRPVTDGK